MDVIREGGKRGANLIICHEALFWNPWRSYGMARVQRDNVPFSPKKPNFWISTASPYGVDHDYIHSGIPLETEAMRMDSFTGTCGYAWLDRIY